jgi:hypothetical protein
MPRRLAKGIMLVLIKLVVIILIASANFVKNHWGDKHNEKSINTVGSVIFFRYFSLWLRYDHCTRASAAGNCGATTTAAAISTASSSSSTTAAALLARGERRTAQGPLETPAGLSAASKKKMSYYDLSRWALSVISQGSPISILPTCP